MATPKQHQADAKANLITSEIKIQQNLSQILVVSNLMDSP